MDGVGLDGIDRRPGAEAPGEDDADPKDSPSQCWNHRHPRRVQRGLLTQMRTIRHGKKQRVQQRRQPPNAINDQPAGEPNGASGRQHRRAAPAPEPEHAQPERAQESA